MRLAVEDLEAGMVLAEEIRDARGLLLLAAGLELTERHLRVLRISGVSVVSAHGGEEGLENPAPVEESMDPAQLEHADARIRPHFRHNDLTHPLMSQLLTYCVFRVAQGHQ